jgi:tartrate-resistant acid phosphatase type 5
MATSRAHFEEYLYLAEITDSSALFAWGGFFFFISDDHPTEGRDWKLVDDDQLKKIIPPRHTTVGARSEAYDRGKGSRVEVREAATDRLAGIGETAGFNHCWVSGLNPNTEYTYKIFVDGKEWGVEEHYNWTVDDKFQGMRKDGGAYVNRFRTWPTITTSARVTFAVLGDYGRGVQKLSTEKIRQREVAAALESAVTADGDDGVQFVVTTGDNIYHHSAGTGKEDDDWFFTFYQPYRYIINRVPVYPTCGNHDDGEVFFESSDDRVQLYDNFYIWERFSGLQGLAAIDDGLFYRVRYGANVELICVDTAKDSLFGKRYFEKQKNQAFLNTAFPIESGGNTVWRIPFGHHPPYCAGPVHDGKKSVREKLVDLYCRRAGVRVFFSGHEHNFQHSQDGGVDFFITGGGGKVEIDLPKNFSDAHTQSWGMGGHFLLITIDGDRMEIQPTGESGPLPIQHPNNQPVAAPIVVTR